MGKLAGRSVISIDDLTNEEIYQLFELADSMETNESTFNRSGTGRIAATLFYEPSTRTRLSFEAAMQRLGGGVISTWDMNASSAVKGESLPDTIRVVASYSDVIILRHPWEGAAQIAGEYASVPVINAGDGGHEHPTQTLGDLYTLHKQHGNLRGLKVALCGDLQHGRTVHSLAFALARFGADVVFVPGENKNIPTYVLHRLERDFGATITEKGLGILSALFGQRDDDENTPEVNAIYMTPTKPNQLALFPQEGAKMDFRISASESLSIYVTRRQVEREEKGSKASSGYPRITGETLKLRPFKNISILHPLPRVDELAPEVDKDPRGLYFRQAANGYKIRMALLHSVLGLDSEEKQNSVIGYSRPAKEPIYIGNDFKCVNSLCVANKLSEFAHNRFEIFRSQNYVLRCLYCDHESEPPFVGNIESHIYYPTHFLDRFRPFVKVTNLRFFTSAQEAQAAGFRPMSASPAEEPTLEDTKTLNDGSWIHAIHSS
ncbi:MAG: hypothetical protein V3S82_11045 [Dehalococcoidia bacterium]